MGVSKRELMEDYYPEEVAAVMNEWNRLHRPEGDEPEEMDAATFLGGGGEWL